MVAETLNMPATAVAVDKPFADYGLDSILGAELVEQIRGALGIKIEQARFYDFSNVSRLEAYIAKTFPEAAAQAETQVEEPAAAPAPVAAPSVRRKRKMKPRHTAASPSPLSA